MGEWTKASDMTARQMVDLPPVWLIGSIVLVWAQVWLWPAGTWPHPVLVTLGNVLFWAGVALMVWAIWSFRQHNTSVVPHQMPQRIITSGPFSFSRNPIYLGDLMVLAGVVLKYGAWPSAVLVPVLGIILLRRFIAPEEARMKQNFGAEFSQYAQKTRRWL